MSNPDQNDMRIMVVMDHLINLTDQVARLADALRAHGIDVPADVGTLGPAGDETVLRLTGDSVRTHLGQEWPPHDAL